MSSYTIGVDFGTNSARAIVVDCSNGKQLGESVFPYPTGHQGILLDEKDHHLARQHPGDYILGLEATITGALGAAELTGAFTRENVIGIGIDTTGSTPMPVDRHGIPLGILPEWKDHLAAQAWLWKDHTATDEARRITECAAEHIVAIGQDRALLLRLGRKRTVSE